MKLLPLLLLFWQLSSPTNEVEKQNEANSVLTKMYNHTRLLIADKEAEEMARTLLIKYPDDPYMYHLWASTEWLLIGRELNLKADEQKDITKINDYQERAVRYHQLVDKGLSLTENAADERMFFLRGALQFDHAKFSARYESRPSGLRRADREAAEGIRILKQILKNNPDFCPAYFLMGGNRLQLSTKIKWIEKPFVWALSKAYAELYSLDKDVINERKSIEWLERAYYCEYSQPWLKKSWIETSLLLMGAYHRITSEKLRKGANKEGFEVLKKEVALLRQLANFFPNNQDITGRLSEKEIQLNTLHNYFSHK